MLLREGTKLNQAGDRWSQTWSSLTVGDFSHCNSFDPPVLVLYIVVSRVVGRKVASENWGKRFVELLSLPFLHCYQLVSLAYQGWGGARGICFLWPSFSVSQAGRNPSFYPLPSSAPAFSWSSWLHLYATGLHPYTLHQIPAHASIAYAFISCPLV